MYTVKQDIIENAVEFGIDLVAVDDNEKSRIKNLIIEKFTNLTANSAFGWDNFSDYSALSDIDGWRHIQDFVGDRSCLLMYEDYGRYNMVQIKSGVQLGKLLEETCAFEFMVADSELTYLLCFTHHDVLMGLGDANAWVEGLK